MDILKKYRTSCQIASMLGLMFILVATDLDLVSRIFSVLLLIVLNLILVVSTGQFTEFLEFIKEARSEISKVVWPSRHEAFRTTGIIAIVVIIVSLLLWILDSITLAIFAKIIQII